MSTAPLLDRILAAVGDPPRDALPLTDGTWTVVVLPVDSERPAHRLVSTYSRRGVAQGVASRWQSDHANAYTVLRHAAGATVYLDGDTILGTGPVPVGRS